MIARVPTRLAGCVALALLLSVGAAWAQDDAPEREALIGRLERLREETAATEARQRALGEELLGIAGDEAKLTERRGETARRVATLETRVAADEEALERLTDDQARVRNELAGKREELAVVLAALQRIGRRPPPALFGESGEATATVRGAMMINAVLPELDTSAQALARDLSRAARLAEDERGRWISLKDDLAALEDERTRLDQLGAELERRRALSTYERQRTDAELARLAQEAGSVEALIAGITGVAPAPPRSGFEGRRGDLADPVAGAVVSEYGEPVEGGGIAEGRTYAALPEATVFAPVDATVLFSAPFRGYGHVLILDAGEGYHIVLAGLELATATPGDRVVAGAPLGRMGRTGRRSTAASAGVRGSALLGSRPALYVELRKDRSAIDSHGWWRVAVADGKRTGG